LRPASAGHCKPFSLFLRLCVGADGVDTYIKSMQAVTADLMKTFEATYLTCG